MPPQAQLPVLSVQIGESIDSMYLGFYSQTMPTNDVTDYLYRVVKPQLDSVEGVKNAEILGARLFALRAWLDSDRMAAHGVTAADVSNALSANNYLAALGSSKGQVVSVDLRAGTDLHTVDEFRKAVGLALDHKRLLEVENGNGKMRILNPLQIVFFEEIEESAAALSR